MGVALDKTLNSEIPIDWYSLTEILPLRPIKSDRAHARAVQVVTTLARLEHRNQAQEDYLEVLSGLIEDYENKRWPVDTKGITVPQIIQSLMTEHGMTQSDLGRLLGERTIGHKILSGKRKLTVNQVKILADRFCVSADLFID